MRCIYNIIIDNFHMKVSAMKPSKLLGFLGPLFHKEVTRQMTGKQPFLPQGGHVLSVQAKREGPREQGEWPT